MFSAPQKDFFILGTIEADRTRTVGPDANFLRRLGHKIHAAYDALRERFDYQENVCAALRHATQLHLLHSRDLEADEVRSRFHSFLASGRSKHRKWFGIDLALALAGSLLTPIPGPNIFFFYPAARALSHYLAAQGAERARHLQMLTYSVDERIDRIEKNWNNLDEVGNEIEELEHSYSISKLRHLLERI